MPYAGNQPYANCFSAKGNIININSFNPKPYEQKLIDYCLNDTGMDHDEFNYLWKDAKNTAFSDSFGSVFWNRTRLITEWVAEQRAYHGKYVKSRMNHPDRQNIQNVPFSYNVATIWNSILRRIGIDGVIDNGASILHTNEPYQQMFFNIRCLYNIQRYDNKWSHDSMPLMNVDLDTKKAVITEKKWRESVMKKLFNIFR